MRLKLIGNVMRRGLAIDRDIEREDHFGDLLIRDPLDQARDAQLFRADLIERA